jgi:hypothetical protein
MKLYHYSAKTGEYLRESEARRDPLDKDQYLIPKHCTPKPPEIPRRANRVAMWKSGRWVKTHDYRGVVYYKGHDKYIVSDIDFDIPAGTTIDPPPKKYRKPFFDGYAWIDKYVEPENDELEFKKAIKSMAAAKDFDDLISILKNMQ